MKPRHWPAGLNAGKVCEPQVTRSNQAQGAKAQGAKAQGAKAKAADVDWATVLSSLFMERHE
jgi:hypothetical protein